MPLPWSIGASRAFCVSIEGGVARYRRTGAVHEPEPVRAADASMGATDSTCTADGDESSAAEVLAELDRASRRREVAPWIPLAAVLVVYVSTIAALGAPLPTFGVVAAFLAALGTMAFLYVVARRADRDLGSARVSYHLDGDAAAAFARLRAAVKRLDACHRVWHVPSEGRVTDGSRKYGAKLYLRRYRIRPALGSPPRVASNLRAPTLYGERRKYYFYPDRVLAFDETGVRSLAYTALAMRTGELLCLEDEDVPFDARVVDTTWLHAKPDGSPDPAIANNRRYPITLYGELEFAGPGGVRELFHFSQPEAADDLVAAVETMAWGGVDEERDDEQEAASAPDDAPEEEDSIERLYDEAIRAFVRAREASLDLLVAELGVSYGRAAALVGRMEEEGYVGPAVRGKARSVNRAAVRYVELVFGERDEARERGEPREQPKTPGGGRRARRRRPNGVPPKRPPHTVLGVRPAATPDEVTAAYRELAQLYHPDKVASLAPEFRELAELRMKEINAAYRAMTKKA